MRSLFMFSVVVCGNVVAKHGDRYFWVEVKTGDRCLFIDLQVVRSDSG
ncbi:hypothetical protein [Chlorogloeopsis sp. ULAP02]